MPKEEWGVKRLCPHCNQRFYDLQKDPMTCPECGQTFTVESLIGGRGRVLVDDKTRGDQVSDDSDLTDDDDLDDDGSDVDLDDDLLEEEDDDNVSLDDIADVAGSDEDS